MFNILQRSTSRAGAERAVRRRLHRLWLLRRYVYRLLDRRHLRDSEIGLALIGVSLGVVVGAGVGLLRELVSLFHWLVFSVPFGGHLSVGLDIPRWQILLATAGGGVVIGLGGILLRRGRGGREIVDPIEANALYGGRMSMLDSLRLVAATVLSNAFGGSVGMEAGYTQTGSGFASMMGQALQLRRADLRVIVGCGASAAIAAAFNAPLTGAFYAFELVIGSYTLGALVPVMAAAIVATALTRATAGIDPIFAITDGTSLDPIDYGVFVLLGFASGWFGIWTMQAVTIIERLFRRLPGPGWTRQAYGGLALGLIALLFPEVLGSGHGAIEFTITEGFPAVYLTGLLIAKALASAISLGAGYRGGLFSSSLFIGSLLGGVAAILGHALLPGLQIPSVAYMLVGMGSVAAAIIGAPITMVMLVLESTGDFPVTVGVLTGVAIATIVVRTCFGYSFATWRFHLKGVPIRGAHDIGWIESLTVLRVMRRDARRVSATMSVAGLRRVHPLGSTKTVYAVDDAGAYVGLIDMSAVHAPELDETAETTLVSALAQQPESYLLPSQNVRAALSRFTETATEQLPVLEDENGRRVIGYLSEAYALRRYSQELERQRGDELGVPNIYGGRL